MMQPHELQDALILYDPAFLEDAESAALLAALLSSVPWKQESGRFGPQPRLTAWYADGGMTYSYSGVTHIGLDWTPVLAELKARVEAACDAKFNSALLNRYRTGADSMGWHADDEAELGREPVIASVSLGAVRRFRLRHNRTRETVNFDLSSGSLLVMAGACQHFWQHAVPKTKAACGERLNLTFRWMHEKTERRAEARRSRGSHPSTA